MSVTAGIPCGRCGPARGGRCQRRDARPHPVALHRCQTLGTHVGLVPHRHGKLGLVFFFLFVSLHLTRMSARGAALPEASRSSHPGTPPPHLPSSHPPATEARWRNERHKFPLNFCAKLPWAPCHPFAESEKRKEWLWWEKTGNLPTEEGGKKEQLHLRSPWIIHEPLFITTRSINMCVWKGSRALPLKHCATFVAPKVDGWEFKPTKQAAAFQLGQRLNSAPLCQEGSTTPGTSRLDSFSLYFKRTRQQQHFHLTLAAARHQN